MRPQACLLRQAGVRVATAATTLNVEEPDQELVALVEAATSRQSEILRGFGNTETVLVPILFMDKRGTVGSVVDRRWVRTGLGASYLTSPQVGFGIVEPVSQELPLITLIYMRPYL